VEALKRGSVGTNQSVVDNLCRWLWEAVAGPIMAELASPAEIVLIPTGWLALLPLHAAWREDPGAPAGRVYLVDECAVTYAANARARRTATNRAARTKTTDYLVVEDPRPTSAGRLDHAGQEADAVLAGVPGRRLRHEQATKAQVRPALREHSVLHFACHGSAKPRAPLHSQLILAHDEPLTLGELITDHLGQARLAVLSACETATIGEELVDEVVNFPTGMLQAGAAACIGSLWSVSDVSTALLMRRFYELWRGGIGPSEALRRAQRWLRDISNEELLEAGYASAPQPGDWTPQVQAFWRKARPYYHPYYWAAFTFYGA
jgi:CHAT domain-containing protein